jgi:ribonuclease HI
MSMITIFSDASHCHKTKSSGFGAWAKRDGWPYGRTYSGRIIGALNAAEAELMGISAALDAIAKDGGLDDVNAIMIQCDSTQALGAIMGKPGLRTRFKASTDKNDVGGPQMTVKRKTSPNERAALDVIASFVLSRWIYLRHVKGHRSGTTRNSVNQKCDEMARRHMEEGRMVA